jgi:hypothetical protein
MPDSGKPQTAASLTETVLFQEEDPQGYLVRLFSETWSRHITLYHPEMSRHLDGVKRTVADPLQIQRQEGRDSTCYYYRYLRHEEFNRADLLYLVVVERFTDFTARVKTAHLLKKMRGKGGEVLWQKN